MESNTYRVATERGVEYVDVKDEPPYRGPTGRAGFAETVVDAVALLAPVVAAVLILRWVYWG